MLKRAKIGLIICVALASTFSATHGALLSKMDHKQYDIYFDDFQKDLFGRPLKLGTDAKISIVLDQNVALNQKLKNAVLRAVEDIDNLLDSVEYDVYLSLAKNHLALDNVINIVMPQGSKEVDPTSLATTQLNVKAVHRYIEFPMSITLNYDHKDIMSEAQWTGVIKHELLHTFGLKDLYEESARDTSIMYYQYDYNRIFPISLKADDIIKMKLVYDKEDLRDNPEKLQKYLDHEAETCM